MAAPNRFDDPFWSNLSASVEQRLDLPSGLLNNVVNKGERSNADQVSEAGAATVYQITPSTRKLVLDKYGVDAYLNPENAAEAAGLLLKESLDRNKGDVASAVGEYHGGTDRANWGPRTRAYVGRVMASQRKEQAQPQSTFQRVQASQQPVTPPNAIAQVYEAYKAGQMTPEEAAEFEADVNSGLVMLPRGATLAGQQSRAPTQMPEPVELPQGVVDVYQSGRMPENERRELEADIQAGIVKLPGQAGIQQPQAGAPSQPQAVPPSPPAAVQPPPAEEPGFLGQIGEMFTGSARETRATQELPELQNSGILNGLDIAPESTAAFSAALGTMTNPQEIAQALSALSPSIGISQDEKGNLIAVNNKTGAAAVINKPGLSGLDIAQGLSVGSAFLPSGRLASAGAGILSNALRLGGGSALTQGAIELLQKLAGGEVNPEEIALAGGVGAALPVATGTIGAGIDAGRRAVQIARAPAGGSAPIVQAAERANIPLMTSDIAPPTTPIGQLSQRLGERLPYVGTGGQRATQQEARQAAIRALGDEYPAPKPEQIIDSLKAQTSKVKKLAGDRIERATTQIDAAGPVGFARTTVSIDDALNALSKPGVVSSDDAVRELQQFRDTLASAPQTYSMLKENRTAFRDVIKGYDSPQRSQLPTRAKGLLDSVYSALTKDMDDAAQSVLSPRDAMRLKEANAIYASEADKLTKTRIKNVLDKGNLTPEVAENLIFSRKRSEVKSLYDSLNSSGRDAMRASLIQRAITKAGGLDDLSPQKFLSEMNRLQANTGVVFKGDQRKQLEGLKSVLEATKRAGQTGITATGQEAFVPVVAGVTGAALGDIGATLATGASAGILARIYESAPVRNLLIRIGSAPGSDASKQLALRVARDISSAAQAARASTEQSKENQ